MTLTTDSLVNLVSNLGTDRDKLTASTIAAGIYSPSVLAEAYRGSWMARKGVDIPALDSCRKWRDWQAENADITLIEAEENRLAVKAKVLAARIAARLYGGAAVLIGAGAQDATQPLTPAQVKRGGIRYLTLLHRRQLSAGELVMDVQNPRFGEPAYWTVNQGGSVSAKIHPSRLVMFKGAEVPDPSMIGLEPGWGDSILVAALDAVLAAESVNRNAASLTFEAKVDTVGIPDFMDSLSDPTFRATVITRFTLAETAKGINGTYIHDKDEILGQKQASFTGLPDLMDRFAQIACAAFDVPATRFMGQSAAGLNATGEGDLRNYYDRISAAQGLEMTPAMSVLDECLIRSALGARPADVYYRWASLWQVSDKERAEIGKTQADTVVALCTTQLIPDEALSQAAVTMLTESGAMPGLEGAVAEYFASNPQEGEDDNLPPPPVVQVAPESDPTKLADAAPRTLYVRRDVINRQDIVSWANAQGFSDIATDLHVTIAFSRAPVDWFKVGQSWSEKLDIAAGGPRQVDRLGLDGKYIALLITASELVWRNQEIRDAGASWDWPDYQPHISIQIGGDIDLAKVTPYQGKIVLGPEIFEEVRED